ncbi:MAG TPA: DUF3224 domain-containing protein [Caldilineaceae bacterium]|nr:DUF3224 domain-containing protein [Caldilineaceae bacterium]
MAHDYKYQAKGTFAIKSWDEKTWDGKEWSEVQGAKLTHAKVVQSFHGDIEAECTAQLLMAYPAEGAVSYTGLQLMTGTLAGRTGTFVLQSSGAFEGDSAKTTWFVTPGSGAGELKGLRGAGGYVAVHGVEQVPYTLDYDFAG